MRGACLSWEKWGADGETELLCSLNRVNRFASNAIYEQSTWWPLEPIPRNSSFGWPPSPSHGSSNREYPMNRSGRLILLATAGLLMLVAARFYMYVLLEPVLVVHHPEEAVDAVVVMAGEPRRRLPPAARLYTEGVAPKILLTNDGIFSSWSTEHHRNLYEVEWSRERLLEAGVPEEDIVLLDYTASGSIHDALNTRAFVLGRGDIRSLLVVTSDYHTRRTHWTFERVFAGEDVDIRVYAVPKDPDFTGRRTLLLTQELVKLVFYRLRYGLLPLPDERGGGGFAHVRPRSGGRAGTNDP